MRVGPHFIVLIVTNGFEKTHKTAYYNYNFC